MVNKDLYSVLGLQHGASIDEVKKAFKKLAVQFHPDKQQGKSDAEKKQAEDKFKEINEAYSTLSDAKKKQEYDQFGSVGDRMGMDGDFADMADFIRNMHSSGMGGFNPFGNGFNSPFGGQTFIKGDDVKIKLNCTIEDIYNGVNKTIKYTRKVKCGSCNGSGSKSGEKTVCPHCHGSGMYTETKRISPFQVIQNTTTCPYCHGTGQIVKDPCSHCNGTGLEETKDSITITIPTEARDGNVMTIPNVGHMAPNNGGQAGDMIIQIKVVPHSVYRIGGNGIDLVCDANVNVFDCITGCEIQVDCINGSKKTLKLPAGTKHKQEFVINSQGMPYGNGYGNLIVSINQIMPSKLSKDETKKINELKDSVKF